MDYLSGLSICVLVICSVQTSFAEDLSCAKCEPPPTNDCIPHGVTPCRCSVGAYVPGCHLKPCRDASFKEVCDKTEHSKTEENLGFKFRCKVGPNGCEQCDEMPSDCTSFSFLKTPDDGGNECACALHRRSPRGCTLKPCGPGVEVPCVCRPGNSPIGCYSSGCPGNLLRNTTAEEDAYQSNADSMQLVNGGFLNMISIVITVLSTSRLM